MRNKLSFLLIIFILGSSGLSWGQKIKYKDLFSLIHMSKKYEEGEPFLRSFLSNPKNVDHPNANFQMGVIHELNAKKKDVLKENVEKITLLDSAVYYYSKAKVLITEKEVRKNSEYYEDEFLRRDLRTGKMGIKMSDVHLDLDKRVERINEHSENLKNIANHFNQAVAEYKVAYEKYGELVNGFDTQRTLYLRASDEVLATSEEIRQAYDSTMYNFGEYKIKIAEVEGVDYDQTLNVLEIKDIKKDGEKTADFYAKDVDVYDFSKWAIGIKSVVVDELRPLKDKIITQDAILNKLYKETLTDSVSVVGKLKLMENEELANQLSKYDENPMPLNLLSLKKAELKYWSLIFDNKPFKDSSSVPLQLSMAKEELEVIANVDSLVNNLLGYNLAIEVENYISYINKQFEGTAGLQRFIRQKLDFAQAEKKYRTTIFEAKEERSKWLLYGNDSIPLFERDTTLQLALTNSTQYVMKGKEESSPGQVLFTYGVKFDVSGAGSVYVTPVTDSLIVSDVSTYAMDTSVFSINKYNLIKHQSVKDEALKLTYVLYYDNSPFDQQEKKAHLTCISGNGRVLWSNALSLVYPPDNMVIYDKGGVSINYDVKFIDTENSAKLVSRLLVGNNGQPVN